MSKDLDLGAVPFRRTIACHLPRSFLIVAIVITIVEVVDE
ncbi:hypothetical protein CCC_01725 [Paramagnetospirillum magnetotacticum MS-1]|uniref:Uncharacterized protein n=1 Tax=Paramagnetospirillum magnetotacticum MS-1 TaxID=272627 RepID=A0A0C2Z1E0_PARME|nr:hypothetical protein CCC_01725 [Paramagnetospirillum magnetotacticum MS-1]